MKRETRTHLRVEVGQADIDSGEPGNPESCPIALAVKRLTGALRVEVDGEGAPNKVVIRWEDRDGFAAMPKSARDFAEDRWADAQGKADSPVIYGT